MLNLKIKQISFLVFGIFFCSIAILIAWHSPAISYEISIYESTPVFFWISIICSIIIGFIAFIDGIYSQKKYGFYIGPFLVVLSTIIVLILPYLRDYTIYGSSDHIFHLQAIDLAYQTGYIESTDFYPAIHILLTSLCNILGVSTISIQSLTPIIFGTFFPLICFIIGRRISNDLKVGAMSCILASVIPFNSLALMIYPFMLALILVGFSIYLIIRFFLFQSNYQSSSLIVLVIFMVAIVISHPIGVIVLVISFIAIGLYSKYTRNFVDSKFHFIASAIIILILFVWLISQPVLNNAIRTFVHSLFDPLTILGVTKGTEITIVLGLPAAFILSMKLYFDTILFTLLAILSWRFFLKFNSFKNNERMLRLIGLIFIAMIAAQFLTLFQRESPGRFLNGAFFLILAIPLSGLFITKFWSSLKKIKIFSIFTIIFVLLISSYATVFHSPFINQAGWMVTEDNFETWDFLEERLNSISSIALLGSDFVDPRVNFTITPHFNNLLGNNGINKIKPWYFVIGERALLVSEDSFLSNNSINQLDAPGFYPSDFTNLNQVTLFDRIWDSGGTWIYIVKN